MGNLITKDLNYHLMTFTETNRKNVLGQLLEDARKELTKVEKSDNGCAENIK